MSAKILAAVLIWAICVLGIVSAGVYVAIHFLAKVW